MTANAPQNAERPSTAEMAEVLRVLGNPLRLEILLWLKDPTRHFPPEQLPADPLATGVCVTYIQAKAGLAQSTTSTYMMAMERAGLVTSSRVGKWVHYRRDDQRIRALTEALGQWL
ncbi:MAG TPA: metalloregulator ArsR/SmtB family transcription factor [Baekduia sp.]|nr:metalloregulator ArsR/SmtB family transcription factor [Baekduia sp.]